MSGNTDLANLPRRFMCTRGLSVLALASNVLWLPQASAGNDRKAKSKAKEEQEASEARISAHFPFGPVRPVRPLKPWPLVTHQGKKTDLLSFCQGHLTAIQLVFTQCSAICPIQGALFAQAQQLAQGRLPRHVQWLSLSIDPLSDTPASLHRWLQSFKAGPNWFAASPHIDSVKDIRALLEQGGELQQETVDAHPGQVYVINKKGQLVHRTPGMPSPVQLIEALQGVAASDV